MLIQPRDVYAAVEPLAVEKNCKSNEEQVHVSAFYH